MRDNLEQAPLVDKPVLPTAPQTGAAAIDAEACYARALVLQREERHEDAGQLFLAAASVWNENQQSGLLARVWNSLGWTYQRQQRWQDAEHSYKAALSLSKAIGDLDEHRQSRENLAKLRAERDATESTRGVLFYGSSSIRFWPFLRYEFADYLVLNHAFGGARLSDCIRLFHESVERCAPRVIILYAGDNDLADGQTPHQILSSLREFLDLVAKKLPSTVVGVISIKPSPMRFGYKNRIEQTNRLIKTLASTRECVTFLDVYERMLTADGTPNEALFLDDRLHMTQAGYEIWEDVVKAYLSQVWPQENVVSSYLPYIWKQSGGDVIGPRREHFRLFSRCLDRNTDLLVYGHAGTRMLVFPTWRGRFTQYERHGMVEALRDRLAEGALQLFCLDGFDGRTLYDRSLQPRDRILRYLKFERYVIEEVLPFSEGKNSDPQVMTHGCSLGAFHALNIAFRHPNLFAGVVALSGRYDLTKSFGGEFRDLFDGYYDEDIYFNTPLHFVPNITDATLLQQLRQLSITVAVGQWDAFIENNRAMSRVLWEKGIWHAFREWGGTAHDFQHWRQMARLYT